MSKSAGSQHLSVSSTKRFLVVFAVMDLRVNVLQPFLFFLLVGSFLQYLALLALR